MRAASGVYEARLVDIDRVIPPGGSRLYQHRATFRVERVFSGPDRGLIHIPANVGGSASCGIEKVEIGETWVLLHKGAEHRFSYADYCSRSSQATPEALASAIAVFGEGKPVPEKARESEGPQPRGPISGESTVRYVNGVTAVALIMAVTVGLALLGKVVVQRIRKRRSAPT